MDWEEDILGEMEGGYENDRFASYWASDTDMTYPLILAKNSGEEPLGDLRLAALRQTGTTAPIRPS